MIFFAFQCTPISNDSALPNLSNSVSNVSLSSIHFEDQDILKIIRSLNYNEAHGYDDTSIRLLKICLFNCEVSFNCYQITTQSGCYQYVVKFSKELSSTQCFNFLKKIIFSVHTNRGFVHLTHVQTSYYPLFMISMLVLPLK